MHEMGRSTSSQGRPVEILSTIESFALSDLTDAGLSHLHGIISLAYLDSDTSLLHLGHSSIAYRFSFLVPLSFVSRLRRAMRVSSNPRPKPNLNYESNYVWAWRLSGYALKDHLCPSDTEGDPRRISSRTPQRCHSLNM